LPDALRVPLLLRRLLPAQIRRLLVQQQQRLLHTRPARCCQRLLPVGIRVLQSYHASNGRGCGRAGLPAHDLHYCCHIAGQNVCLLLLCVWQRLEQPPAPAGKGLTHRLLQQLGSDPTLQTVTDAASTAAAQTCEIHSHDEEEQPKASVRACKLILVCVCLVFDVCLCMHLNCSGAAPAAA
jgi:hypothetical protein